MDQTSSTDSQGQGAGQITLPAGVRVSPGRETSQINQAGQVVQGTLYPITLGNGTTSTVFVPNDLLTQPDQVQALFEQKVAALNAIPVG